MEFSERCLRDLMWAVNSPSLINADSLVDDASTDDAGESEFVSRPVDRANIDREHLAGVMAPYATPRVGRYFERLVMYWVRDLRGCEIIAESLPIMDGKRTVGELDLVFRDEAGRLCHWEIAVKFYLHTLPRAPQNPTYVGPNANDTLAKKLAKLRTHQLPLSRHHFPDVELRHAFVRGRIFYHVKHRVEKIEDPVLGRHHLRSSWLRAREVADVVGGVPAQYRILQKPFWLAEEIAYPADSDLLSGTDLAMHLAEHFQRDQRAVLISQFAEDNRQPSNESKRFFVVPDRWPERD